MFFNVVCYCGMPICMFGRLYILSKLLNFQDQADTIQRSMILIKEDFQGEILDKVIDFLFVSFDHINVFQVLDKQKAINDLVK